MITLNPILKHRKIEVGISWLPPKHGWISLNTNGVSKANMNIVVCGGVIIDCVGQWLCGFSRHIGAANAYIPELLGALDGLALAHEKSFNKVELRIDS